MIKPIAFLLAIAFVSPAFAAVNLLSSSGDADIEILYEGTGVVKKQAIALDQSEMGLSEISPGTRVSSYLIMISDFDSCSLHPYEASFSFDAPVLGIQTNANSLRSGRRILANSGFDPVAPAGGLERNDSVTLNGDLVVEGRVGRQGTDPIRVFIEATAVPELASMGVWGALSLAGVFSMNRRRR